MKLQVTSYKLQVTDYGLRNRGFTLALAVLVASVLLMMSLTVFGLILGSLQSASLGRDSQAAFFAADGGAECALYWDIDFDSFATTTAPAPINCAGANTEESVGGAGTSYFHLDFSNGSCVYVTVYKALYYPDTVIESRGYNTCGTGRHVERALRVTYYDWRLL